MDDKPYVYVLTGSHGEFLEYQKMNGAYNCVQIIDDFTLRARTPGKIVRYGTYKELWNIQAIEESIATHEELWGITEDHNPNEVMDLNESDDIMDYGIS